MLRRGNGNRNKAICILGSGRCGTSMVTRAVHFLGVDLGTGFVAPDETNPKGFWENKQVVDIQKEINARMNWKRPFPRGWHRDEDMQPFKKQLKQIVKEQFTDKSVWAWKDPRNCECIEMWQDIFKALRISVGYMIMVRNPVDVAASFRKAYHRKEKTMIDLWQMRTLISLKKTHEDKRIVIDYNDFLENNFERLRDISNTFHLPWPKDETRLQNQLAAFVDPDLRHNQSGFGALAHHKDVNDEVKQLYELCLEAAHAPDRLQSRRFQSKVDELYESFLKSRMKA